jgi:hypothetical protein
VRQDWIHLAQDMDQCQAPVNTITNSGVPLKGGVFFEQPIFWEILFLEVI